MRWSPFCEGMWKAMVPATTPGAPSRTADEMKWNETKWMGCVWRRGGFKFVGGEIGRNSEKIYPDSVSSITTPTWSDRDANYDPGSRRRASNRVGIDYARKRKKFINYARWWVGSVVKVPSCVGGFLYTEVVILSLFLSMRMSTNGSFPWLSFTIVNDMDGLCVEMF